MVIAGLNQINKTAEVIVDIPFHDLDGMDVVWHGHYYKYFEIARTAYLRRIGFDISEMKSSGFIWPVIESHCRYVAPLRYGMKIRVTAAIEDVEHRVKFKYTIYDNASNKRLAYGHTVQAAVDAKTGELCLMTPQVFLDRLK